jgi:hypothetical protein
VTMIEQARRILKAAPHLPFQAVTGLAILLFGIPMLSYQMFDSVHIQWVETKGTVSTVRGVQDRIRNGKVEYFYSINYAYDVGGQTFIVPVEHAYAYREFAEKGQKEAMAESRPVAIWFDKANPSRATTDEPNVMWPAYLGILVILVFTLLYFAWLMLKYYELELEGKEVEEGV